MSKFHLPLTRGETNSHTAPTVSPEVYGVAYDRYARINVVTDNVAALVSKDYPGVTNEPLVEQPLIQATPNVATTILPVNEGPVLSPQVAKAAIVDVRNQREFNDQQALATDARSIIDTEAV